MKIGIVIGSNRPGRNADAVKSWLLERTNQYEGDLEFSFVDLADWNLPLFNEPGFPASGQYEHELTKKWSAEVSQYDGFVFVVPEYNRGAPAVLKNAIDYLYNEWAYKPVAFVGYGSAGGAHSIYGLRVVASELNMVDIRKQVTINVWTAVKDGEWIAGDAYDNTLNDTLTQLEWWTKALVDAKKNSAPTS